MRSTEDGGACEKRDVPVFYAQKGDIWNNFPGKGMSMECLSPDGRTEFTDRNEESLVFRLTTDVFPCSSREIWRHPGRKHF